MNSPAQQQYINPTTEAKTRRKTKMSLPKDTNKKTRERGTKKKTQKVIGLQLYYTQKYIYAVLRHLFSLSLSLSLT